MPPTPTSPWRRNHYSHALANARQCAPATAARRSRSRGMALAIVLSVLVLLMIIIAAVAAQGIGALHEVEVTRLSKQSAYAAEAGAADAIWHLEEDPGFTTTIATDFGNDQHYKARVFNNFGGSSTVTATNGAEVPPGYAYVLATGARRDGAYARQVGVLLTGATGSSLQFAIGSGGGVTLRGNKTVRGSVKANGDIILQGNSDVSPQNGSGRLLSSSDIHAQGNTRMDSGQDARAQGTVSSQPSIRGNPTVVSGDTTPSTQPFINDGRTTNSTTGAEPGQLVLPNPDPSLLLPDAATGQANWSDPAGVVVETQTSVNGPFPLQGQTYYFPNGVTFGGASRITGPGTIVSGNGCGITFQGNLGTVKMNVIALRRPDQMPSGGDPSIHFQGNGTIEGLVYAHQNITTQGNFHVKGMMIAYQGNVTAQGNFSIVYDPSQLAKIPGFAPWASAKGGQPGGGPGTLEVVSWQRF